ncbi:MAG: HprK-related kinase B [Desulfovibrionaceae bacterium]
MNTPTVKALAERLRAELPAPHVLDLDLGGLKIRVGCSSEPLREALADYFKEFTGVFPFPDVLITAHEAPAPEPGLGAGVEYQVKEPDPGKSKIKEEWADLEDGRIVRKRLTGLVFAFGLGVNAVVGPCLENANQVINFVNNRLLEHRLNNGGLLGHASGVHLHGRGISLAGFSGAGKSTLALHLMSRGTHFVSNDRVVVRERGGEVEMFGVAKQPRINPGTALNNPDLARIVPPEERERFAALPLEELWSLEHKYDALIDVCYGPGLFQLHSPMDALVILNWRRDGGPTRVARADARDRHDLLPAFMKPTGLFYHPADPARTADPGIEAYAELLSRAELIEISGGVDFHLAAGACLKYLETGVVPNV